MVDFTSWARGDAPSRTVLRTPKSNPPARPTETERTSPPRSENYPAPSAGTLIQSPPPQTHQGIVLEFSPRTCALVKPCPDGQDTYARLLARLPDLVHTGQLPDQNPEGRNALLAPGGVPGAPMRDWTPTTVSAYGGTHRGGAVSSYLSRYGYQRG